MRCHRSHRTNILEAPVWLLYAVVARLLPREFPFCIAERSTSNDRPDRGSKELMSRPYVATSMVRIGVTLPQRP
jgi:hypothetical protein